MAVSITCGITAMDRMDTNKITRTIVRTILTGRLIFNKNLLFAFLNNASSIARMGIFRINAMIPPAINGMQILRHSFKNPTTTGK